jgi:tetratricopeptide (TPR) repeat protein
VKKQQVILLATSAILLAVLYFFSNTVPPVSKSTDTPEATGETKPITTKSLIDSAKSPLNTQQLSYLTQLENSVVRGNVKEQQIAVYKQLAMYWQDSLKHPEIAAFYTGEEAKLENSEKSLTFAARLFLGQVMAGGDPSLQVWMATNAKALFEQALKMNPESDSLKVELGACFLFGNISSTPMEGILKIKEVADKDSTNMYAQLMLGLGDIKSGQYDKAIERLQRVVKQEPTNLQALFNLAETYERKGDKQNAILWYRTVQNMINIPEAKQELENRIQSLQ